MHDWTVREALLQASSLLVRTWAERERAEDERDAVPAGGLDAVPTNEDVGRDTEGGLRVGDMTDAGGAEARADAERLLMHVLGWDKTRLLLEGDAPFPAHLMERWQTMLARRIAGEPVQYITGEQDFYGWTFAVGPGVLIPRPETELLVEAVAQRVRALFGNPSAPARATNGQRMPLLADIGTGSGAIAITLARLLPDWRVAACDVSGDALEIARRNAERATEVESDQGKLTESVGAGSTGSTDGTDGTDGTDSIDSTDGTDGIVSTGRRLLDRIVFLQGDLLEPLTNLGERVDVLVSNPPYIPSGELPRLQQEVRDHEPQLALDGGPDGLAVYRRIVQQISEWPEPPRLVAFEVGQGQARDVAALLGQEGHWPECEIMEDYAGIERHVLVWRA